MSTEKERETQVYMAKLAEQAERYEGSLLYLPLSLFVSFIKFACLGILIWICLFKASALRFVFRLVFNYFCVCVI